ncbi:MAG: histidinol-phosphate transaminase [Clostridia bacterium]|nr:histidinol-phosphate transaminase [Clostridia bacterium]
MSRYLSSRLQSLTPYTPGEQPRDKSYVKLNTNESPFAPSPLAIEAVDKDMLADLRLYSDPTADELAGEIARCYSVDKDNVLVTNGSDEALAFCFLAFCDRYKGVAFADVTYGFYKVYAALFNVPARIIPLDSDYRVKASDYMGIGCNILIANPNAQTGIAIGAKEIEEIVAANSDSVVIIDEAYADFSEVSCVPLVNKYDNVVVVRTMSKSRSLAGARIGYALASEQLAGDLRTVKYSFNPYNLGTLPIAMGAAALRDGAYFDRCVDLIRSNRTYLTEQLAERGFYVLPSSANFLLARSGAIGGKRLYLALKDKGVLVRHLADERIEDFVRITIGDRAQCDALLAAIDTITEAL